MSDDVTGPWWVKILVAAIPAGTVAVVCTLFAKERPFMTIMKALGIGVAVFVVLVILVEWWSRRRLRKRECEKAAQLLAEQKSKETARQALWRAFLAQEITCQGNCGSRCQPRRDFYKSLDQAKIDMDEMCSKCFWHHFEPEAASEHPELRRWPDNPPIDWDGGDAPSLSVASHVTPCIQCGEPSPGMTDADGKPLCLKHFNDHIAKAQAAMPDRSQWSMEEYAWPERRKTPPPKKGK